MRRITTWAAAVALIFGLGATVLAFGGSAGAQPLPAALSQAWSQGCYAAYCAPAANVTVQPTQPRPDPVAAPSDLTPVTSGLALTGGDIVGTVVVGLILLAGGALVVVASRRRPRLG